MNIKLTGLAVLFLDVSSLDSGSSQWEVGRRDHGLSVLTWPWDTDRFKVTAGIKLNITAPTIKVVLLSDKILKCHV